MSTVAFHSTIAPPPGLRAVLDWLRHARVAIHLTQQNVVHQDVEDLSDRELRDIGGERKDVARAMDRELGRLGLLDIGWQRNRQW